ncbi:MAG: hypothetical protein ACRDVW_10380 [Acidimicrobiales bacterium]
MSPVQRRDLTPFVVLLVVGAVVLFLLVGGLASVGRSSGPCRSSIDRSFAAEAKVLIAQSNAVGSQLRAVVSQEAGYNRTALAQALDAVVAGADGVQSDARGVASADRRVTTEFSEAVNDRAIAVNELRSTIDGLLSITPSSVTASGEPGSPFPPPALTAAQAEKHLTSVGALLVTADRSYKLARQEFVRAPGGSQLPTSVWVPSPVLWDPGAVDTAVNQLTSAPGLTPQVDVQVVALALDPPALPPDPAGQQSAAGASEIPPTCRISVTAVVRNEGSVVVTKVPVQASVHDVAGGTPFVVKKLVTLAPSGSRALSLPAMAVSPGATYTLTVTLGAVNGQSPAPAPEQAAIAVASFGSAKANAVCARTRPAAP